MVIRAAARRSRALEGTFVAAAWVAVAATATAGPPVFFWASAPAEPNETLLLLGGGLARVSAVDIRRVPDSDTPPPPEEQAWASCPTMQPADHSVKVVIPRTMRPGVYAVRASVGGATGDEFLVNAADPWWHQGDEGQAATPGGWLRIFGTCLGFDREASLILRDEAGNERTLKPAVQSRWELRAEVPRDIHPGRHELLVSNGYGGSAGYRSVGMVPVVPPPAWKQDVFEVPRKDTGDGDEAAVVAALRRAARNGGGVVLLRRGVYDMRGPVTIPPRTVLRGEDQDGVSLQWPDLQTPPEALITANDAALEELSIYCRRHATVIHSGPESQRFRMHRVRVRADAFFMHVGPGKTHRGRQAPKELGEGRVVHVVGRNFQITDCDLRGSGQVLAIDPHTFAGKNRPWYGLIAGNRIAYGYQGHLFENVDRLIFEENDLCGNGSAAGSNGISTYWNSFAKHVFYARNHVHDIYGIDREAMTLDGDGAAYFGKARAEGDRLHLDGDPEFHDYAPTPHTDYRGGVVYVLEGTGAGQYRLVTGHRDREWVIDRPWDVPLDGTSVVSIVPFRGRNLFVENSVADAGPFQLYGSAADVIVADNVTRRADGLLAWGLSQHGWGWHPVLRCQFLGNKVTGGSGYGARVSGPASISVATTGNSDTYRGPLARAMVIRGNVLEDQAIVALDGTLSDVVVEDNSFKGAAQGIRVGKDVTGAVVRRNAFQEVREPVTGPGAPRVQSVR